MSMAFLVSNTTLDINNVNIIHKTFNTDNLDMFSQCLFASMISAFHIFYLVILGFIFRKIG